MLLRPVRRIRGMLNGCNHAEYVFQGGKKKSGKAEDTEDWGKKDYIEESYKLALRVGVRPWRFWKLKPVELAEIAEAYYARETEKDKQKWRRAAFIASWIINTAGKTYKRDISANELLGFTDEVKKNEIKPLSMEERRRQADEAFMLHKKKFWMLFELDSEGKVKVFDEEKLKELKERYKK